jgi:hypothetical protein
MSDTSGTDGLDVIKMGRSSVEIIADSTAR